MSSVLKLAIGNTATAALLKPTNAAGSIFANLAKIAGTVLSVNAPSCALVNAAACTVESKFKSATVNLPKSTGLIVVTSVVAQCH